MQPAASDWTSEFFDELAIVDTFQHLLQTTQQTVEDLCRLCVAAREDRVVLAFSVHGLMPFANHPEYVFDFSKMSHRQLQSLRWHYKNLPDTMTCEYDVDLYVLKRSPENFEIEHALVLFAAGCLLLKGLCKTNAVARGFSYERLSNDKALLAYHANAILFHIVNACRVKSGALRTAVGLFAKHDVAP